jgi:hypothetical protein
MVVDTPEVGSGADSSPYRTAFNTDAIGIVIVSSCAVPYYHLGAIAV